MHPGCCFPPPHPHLTRCQTPSGDLQRLPGPIGIQAPSTPSGPCQGTSIWTLVPSVSAARAHLFPKCKSDPIAPVSPLRVSGWVGGHHLSPNHLCLHGLAGPPFLQTFSAPAACASFGPVMPQDLCCPSSSRVQTPSTSRALLKHHQPEQVSAPGWPYIIHSFLCRTGQWLCDISSWTTGWLRTLPPPPHEDDTCLSFRGFEEALAQTE